MWRKIPTARGRSACPDLVISHDIVRFEVQCKYQKVYSLSAITRERERDLVIPFDTFDDLFSGVTVPIQSMLSGSIADSVIRKYFKKVVRSGDYLTLDAARCMVKAHGYRPEKEARLINAL